MSAQKTDPLPSPPREPHDRWMEEAFPPTPAPPPPADDDDAPPAADAPPNKRKRGVPAKIPI